MSTHDYGSGPDDGEYGPAGQTGDGYRYPPDTDPAAYGPHYPRDAADHGPRGGDLYGSAPSGGDPYGYGPQGADHPGQAYGHSAGHPQGGAYVPEPMGGQQPLRDPEAAFGMPAAGDAWAGHAPAAPDGWAGAQPWEAAPAGPAGTWEHAGSGGYAYGSPQQWSEPMPPTQPPTQPQPQPHAYADPQPYAVAGIEHTAVLPVVEGVAMPPPPARPPARTGSPIIPPGIQPAGLTAALGLLLAGGAAVGKPGLTVFLVALQAVTAAGWFRLNGMWPARQGILLAFLGGVTADIALLAVDGKQGPLALAGTLGAWLLLVFVLQLRHHGSADERLSSLTATSASALLAVLAACYLATATSHAGTDPVVVGAIAVGAATVVRALRLPGGQPVSLLLAVAAAALSGLATGPATGFGAPHALLLAALCGGCALVGLRVASYDFPSRFVHFTAGVALPLTAAAPVVYVLGRVLS
jgi:hypothetical protein